jgi:hypothetical protein
MSSAEVLERFDRQKIHRPPFDEDGSVIGFVLWGNPQHELVPDRAPVHWVVGRIGGGVIFFVHLAEVVHSGPSQECLCPGLANDLQALLGIKGELEQRGGRRTLTANGCIQASVESSCHPESLYYAFGF